MVNVRVTFQSSNAKKSAALARCPTSGIPATTLEKKMFEYDVPFPPAPAGPAGNPSRKSGNDRSVMKPCRVIALMIELVSEDFCAHAKIVLAPRQEYDVGNVKVITGCFALVVAGVAQAQRRREPQFGECPLLGVAEAVYPHILICERPSGNALTRKTREAKSELVDRSRRENVSLGDCQVPVLKGTQRRKARHAGAEERNVLVRV